MSSFDIKNQPANGAWKKVLIAVGVLTVIGLVIGGMVYGGIKNSGKTSSDGLRAGHGGLLSTADQLSDHAAAMRRHGEEMVEIGNEQAREDWIEQGADLMLEARQLDTVADQLRRTDRDLSIFRPEDSVDIYRLRADGRAIVDAGREFLDHANEMEKTATAMEADAAGSPELARGAELVADDAETLKKGGRAVIAAGQPLIDEADQLERSLGH